MLRKISEEKSTSNVKNDLHPTLGAFIRVFICSLFLKYVVSKSCFVALKKEKIHQTRYQSRMMGTVY